MAYGNSRGNLCNDYSGDHQNNCWLFSLSEILQSKIQHTRPQRDCIVDIGYLQVAKDLLRVPVHIIYAGRVFKPFSIKNLNSEFLRLDIVQARMVEILEEAC